MDLILLSVTGYIVIREAVIEIACSFAYLTVKNKFYIHCTPKYQNYFYYVCVMLVYVVSPYFKLFFNYLFIITYFTKT